MDSNNYTLLDFGGGRRLERFGPLLLDRPCPTATGVAPRNPTAWNSAAAVFLEERRSSTDGRGRWQILHQEPRLAVDQEPGPAVNQEPGPAVPEAWRTDFGPLSLELRCTPFGHVGVFPEQAENWKRIRSMLSEAATRRSTPIRVLNLFAYTGGSSLAAASAAMNVEVVHVDAAKNLLGWAKRNAELNGLQNAKIRWIAEDARKFVRRELKRNNAYNAVILDPPSYGHGSGGEVWKLIEHLPDLLDDLFRLIAADPLFVLLTAHTPNVDAVRLEAMVRSVGPPSGMKTTLAELFIQAETGKKLPSGDSVLLRR